jgi:hypothetical protein
MAFRKRLPGCLTLVYCLIVAPGPLQISAVSRAAEPRKPATSIVLRRANQPPAPPSAPTLGQDTVEQLPSPSTLPACKPLDQILAGVRLPQGDLPPDLSEHCFSNVFYAGNVGRPWAEFSYAWEASQLYHLPLYFEDVPLERYGHTICPLAQPAISAAHFFGTAPLLPYKLGLEPALEHVYALGYYRPGSLAPRLLYVPPLRLDAASLEAASITGLILLIP